MTDFSPRLGLPYLQPSQAQKHVTVNESLAALDVHVQLVVQARDLATPPAAPNEGDGYLLPEGATGAWDGRAAGEIASWQDGAWAFRTPQAGWRAWCTADDTLLLYDGAGWASLFTADTDQGRLGIGTDTPAYTLDVNGLVASSGGSPGFYVMETDQSENNRIWRITSGGGNFFVQTLNDSGNLAQQALVITRDGTTIDSIRLLTNGAMAMYVDSNQNVAIGHQSPSTSLHVNGPVRVGQSTAANLPPANLVGAGALLVVSDTPLGVQLAYSDGHDWRTVRDGQLV
jgi:hypothetical protein